MGKSWFVPLLGVLLVVGCMTYEVTELPADPAAYDPLAAFDYMAIPADNPLTFEKARLGRQLYYDYRLSGDGSRSCYYCHRVEKGLTDGRALAVGAYDKQLTRSSPTMWNIGYHQNWYWDGRAATLEAQAKAAWKGGNMGAADTAPVLAEINGLEEYRQQFLDVFGEQASEDNIPAALAAYMRTIVSGDTAWDRYMDGDETALSPAAVRGWEVFQRIECTNCHAGVLFTDLQFHNVGIGMDAEEPDVGRFKVTQLEQDRGAFKTPTLRDISKSAPYFHNGHAKTLREAVRLMVDGGLENPWIDRAKLKPAEVTEDEFDDLIALLESLDQPITPWVRRPERP